MKKISISLFVYVSIMLNPTSGDPPETPQANKLPEDALGISNALIELSSFRRNSQARTEVPTTMGPAAITQQP